MTISPPERATASTRVRLARLAHEAAVAVDGVVGTDAGSVGARATFGGAERIGGVVCTAVGNGVYGLELFLVAEQVALRPLAERVRSAVRTEVARAGLDEFLGPIDIAFVDVAGATDSEAA